MSARILIVDDDPAMCTMVRAHLVKRRYDVTACEAAASAFELLRASDFDAVVTDLQMPGMNGLELCERISCYCHCCCEDSDASIECIRRTRLHPPYPTRSSSPGSQ